jgi:O-antigen/teichoic acid export membrane protein
MKSTLKPTLLLMCGRSAAFAVTFLIPVVLVRTFDQVAFGTYKQLFLIYGTLFTIAQFGMAESLYYFLPNNPKKAGRLGANSTLLLAFFGAACAIGLTWQASRIAGWFRNPALEEFLPWLGGYLALTLVGATLEIAMVSQQRYGLAAVTMGTSEVFRALLFVLPAFFTGELRWLLVGAMAFATLRLTVAGLYAGQDFDDKFLPDSGLLKKQLTYALPFQLAVLIEVLQINYHQYAVSYAFDAATFAIYAVGCLQLPASELLAGPAANVMMVRMGEELREGRRQNVLPVWEDTTRKLLLILIPLTGFLMVAAHDLIVLLFTNAYLASVSIFALWALTTAPSAFPTDAVLRVYADTRTIFWLNMGRLIFVASLIGFAISSFSLIGPVLVTLGALYLAKMAALGRIAQLMSVRMRHIVDWKTAGISLAITVLSAVIATGVRRQFDVAPIVGLILLGSTYGTCCIGMLGAWWLQRTRSIKTCAELPESSA